MQLTITSCIEVLRGQPPGYTGMRGLTSTHCPSVRSLGIAKFAYLIIRS